MKTFSNIHFNYASIIALSIIYFGIILMSILGYKTEVFLVKDSIGIFEIISLLIFILTIHLGNKNIKLYSYLLVFNILAMPANLDNFFPSVLISSPIDLKTVYFPMITHIDIFLLFGIIKHGFTKKQNEIYFIGTEWKVIFSLLLLLIVSITLNIIKYSSIYDASLILSHSYHLRYLLLLLLLFFNTSIVSHKHQIFSGIIISVTFLAIESFLYSYGFYFRTRLVSGTLGNNVFANILTAINCYFIYLLIRKRISIKYLKLVVLLTVLVILTKTRSALFLLFIYIIFEFVTYIIRLYKFRLLKKAFYLTFLFLIALVFSFYIFSHNERLFLNNFKIEKIDFSKSTLNDIIVLEENNFNASLILRLNHYQTSLNMIKEEPLFGIGAGRWNSYKHRYGSKDNNVLDSHNDFLAVASQYGIPIAILLCFSIFLFPFFLSNQNRLDNNIINNSLIYLFIINLIMMFAGLSNAGMFKNQIFGFLALILIFFIFNKSQKIN